MGTETGAATPAAPSDEQLVVEYLRQREALCPVCQYNLHLLTVPRCPECGRELRLTVGTLEPFMRAWICLAVATFASAGLGVFCAVAIVMYVLPMAELATLRDAAIAGAMLYFISNIPAAAVVVGARRRFLKWSRTTQWCIAGMALVASLVVFGTLMVALSS